MAQWALCTKCKTAEITSYTSHVSGLTGLRNSLSPSIGKLRLQWQGLPKTVRMRQEFNGMDREKCGSWFRQTCVAPGSYSHMFNSHTLQCMPLHITSDRSVIWVNATAFMLHIHATALIFIKMKVN